MPRERVTRFSQLCHQKLVTLNLVTLAVSAVQALKIVDEDVLGGAGEDFAHGDGVDVRELRDLGQHVGDEADVPEKRKFNN